MSVAIVTRVEKIEFCSWFFYGGENGGASMLGVNPITLRRRMKKLKIPYGRNRKKETTRLTYPCFYGGYNV